MSGGGGRMHTRQWVKKWGSGVAALALLAGCPGSGANEEADMPRPLRAQTVSGTGWTRQEGGPGPEQLHALAADGRGGFVAAGLFGEAPFPNGTGLALSRHAADGSPVWTRQVTTTEDVRALAIEVMPRGDILVVGHYADNPDLGTGPLTPVPNSGSGLFLARFSPTGKTLWSHGFIAIHELPGGGHWYGSVIPTAMTADAHGRLLVVGHFYGTVDFGGGPLFAGEASLSDDESSPGGFAVCFSAEGQHLWSRAFEALPSKTWARVRTVTVDAMGHLLVGGRVSQGTDLGDGPVESSGAFIARYHGNSGALLWKRLFPGTSGEVIALEGLSTTDVAFNAHLGGPFTFGGQLHAEGTTSAPHGYTGSLRLTGTDRWIRTLGHVTLGGLVEGRGGARILTGQGVDGTSAWGDTRFVARYSETGTPQSSHVFARSAEGILPPAFLLAPQSGNTVVAGMTLGAPVQHEGTVYTPQGASDLLFFPLRP